MKKLILTIFISFFCLNIANIVWAEAKFSISGLIDGRYSYKETNGEKVPFGSTYRNGLTYNLEVYPRFELNDNWNITAIICYSKNANGKEEDPFDLYRIAANGKIGNADLTIGSFKYWPLNGLIHGDGRIDGAKVSFGGKLRATLVFGKDMGWRHRGEQYREFGLDFTLTPKVDLRGGFFTQQHPEKRKDLWGLGADIKLNKDFVFTSDYASSNYDQDKTSYLVGINYLGGKNPAKEKNKLGCWLHFMQVTPNGSFNADTDVPDIDGFENNNGNRGITTGIAYMLNKNLKWSIKYFDFKDVNNGKNSKVYRTQAELFF